MKDRVAVDMAAFGATVVKAFWMPGLMSKVPVTDVVARHPARVDKLRMQKGAPVVGGRCMSSAAGMVHKM
ncbi:MAG: hypothetical protein NXI08_17295, partial [bacterium]|nr:hypothetical protein [bacterium]